jgi:hypothetical protein
MVLCASEQLRQSKENLILCGKALSAGVFLCG